MTPRVKLEQAMASQKKSELLIEFAFAGVTTNQYNPVCGTDNQTYHNQERLDCARECGVSKYFIDRKEQFNYAARFILITAFCAVVHGKFVKYLFLEH